MRFHTAMFRYVIILLEASSGVRCILMLTIFDGAIFDCFCLGSTCLFDCMVSRDWKGRRSWSKVLDTFKPSSLLMVLLVLFSILKACYSFLLSCYGGYLTGLINFYEMVAVFRGFCHDWLAAIFLQYSDIFL